jgi:hypothetical protein
MEISKELIDEIKKSISDLHSTDENAIKKYSLQIHRIIHEKLFPDALGDKYLYSTLLFVKNDIILEHEFLFSEQTPSKYANSEIVKNYVQNIQPKLSRHLRNKEETIGISNQLILSKNDSLVLYSSSDKKINESTIRVNNEISLSYNLDLINIPEKELVKIYNCKIKENTPEEVFTGNFYEDFVDNNKTLNHLKKKLKVKSKQNMLKPILSLYAIGGYSKSIRNYYVYFIKPSTKQKYYNGLLNIALTRPLRKNELVIIDLLLFYIFSEIAVKELSLKNEEKLHIELAHSINSDLGDALNKLENSFDDSLSNKEKARNANLAHKLLEKAYINGKALLLLEKKRKSAVPFKYIEFDLGLIETNLIKGLKKNHNRFKKEPLIENILVFKNISSKSFLVEESFDILMYNIINNAITHTKEDFNKLKISIEDGVKFFVIKIFNDGFINDSVYESIKNNFLSSEGFNDGLRTISKIHNIVPGLSVSVERNKKNVQTCFIIKIIKIYEK